MCCKEEEIERAKKEKEPPWVPGNISELGSCAFRSPDMGLTHLRDSGFSEKRSKSYVNLSYRKGKLCKSYVMRTWDLIGSTRFEPVFNFFVVRLARAIRNESCRQPNSFLVFLCFWSPFKVIGVIKRAPALFSSTDCSSTTSRPFYFLFVFCFLLYLSIWSDKFFFPSLFLRDRRGRLLIFVYLTRVEGGVDKKKRKKVKYKTYPLLCTLGVRLLENVSFQRDDTSFCLYYHIIFFFLYVIFLNYHGGILLFTSTLSQSSPFLVLSSSFAFRIRHQWNT